jgi:uncharacterized protein with ACT and thioredoxin-like domain
MNILSIRKASNVGGAVRIYAKVMSRTRAAITHNVVYLRKAGMKRWLCSCEDFLFRQAGHRKHCDHIKDVRRKLDLERVYGSYQGFGY